MTAKTVTLGRCERIIAAVPERCQGPGWSNSVVWVYIASQDGRLRTECLQPCEQTHEMQTLFDAGAAMCRSLVDAVSHESMGYSGFPHRKRRRYGEHDGEHDSDLDTGAELRVPRLRGGRGLARPRGLLARTKPSCWREQHGAQPRRRSCLPGVRPRVRGGLQVLMRSETMTSEDQDLPGMLVMAIMPRDGHAG